MKKFIYNTFIYPFILIYYKLRLYFHKKAFIKNVNKLLNEVDAIEIESLIENLNNDN